MGLPDDHSMAVDTDGRPLPFTPAEVKQRVLRMIDAGKIVAVVVRSGDDLGVQVFGPPSRELLDVLEQTTTAYRRVLEGQ